MGSTCALRSNCTIGFVCPGPAKWASVQVRLPLGCRGQIGTRFSAAVRLHPFSSKLVREGLLGSNFDEPVNLPSMRVAG